jgi:glycosyltransferase involved in cell wall biosynthesis
MSIAPAISLVVPVFNEESVLPEFIARAQAALDITGSSWEIIFADDGSTDGTADIIRAYRCQDPRLGLISLSRNFGKEAAMTAGMDHALGQVVVIIDADLQDPPELIVDLVAYWRKGYDVVYARRTVREGEPALKRLTAHFFYRVINLLADHPIPADVGDFRLMSRRAVDALLRLRERRRFMKGLFAWIGFRQIEVPYKRAPRAAGRTKWNYWKLWNFSLEGITGFSIRPLQFATYFGLTIAIVAALYGVFIVLHTISSGSAVPGYPSLLVTVLFLGGVQLITLGIIGEYIGRISDETKQRPLYFVTQALLGTQLQDQLGEEGALRHRGNGRWHRASSSGGDLARAA